MKLMIWGGNLALTGGDIFAFPDWKEVIRKVGQYGFTPLLSTKIPLKEDDIYFLKESGIKFLQFSLDSIFTSTLQTMVRVKEDYIDNVKQSVAGYIGKCDNRILAEFSRLIGRNSEYTSIFRKKLDTSELGAVLDEIVKSYSAIKDTDNRTGLVDTLDSINTPIEYLVTVDGNIAYRVIND